MSVIHTPRKPELELRILAFPVVMGVLLLVLFMRLWYFQVVKAPELVEKAEFSRTIEVTSPAPRGLIYDRNGELVAGVKPEIVITAVPNVVKKNPWVLDRVAQILKVDPRKLELKVKDASWRPFLPSTVYVGASIKDGAMISESHDDLPGIGVAMQPMRYYPDSLSFTHLLGYVWTPSKDDLTRIEGLGRKPADYVGRTGIERAYETSLMGDPGAEKQEIDAKRRPVRIAERDSANPGDQLVLTIDSKLQKFATNYLKDHQQVGGVVALDPRTGEVLCLVSSPTFDQNVFTGGDLKSVLDNEERPLIDRAIRSSYSPGSTFKIVTSIAAYYKGVFDPDKYFFCAGGVKVGRHGFVKCLGYHRNIGYYDAMAKSCNSYFCQLGKEAGEDSLRKAALDVGFGVKEGIDIGGEVNGVVPTEAYIEKRHLKWYTGDTFNFSIGQGYVSATPLQLANLAALVANSGTNYVPHLVKEIRSADGKGAKTVVQPQICHHVDASPKFWTELQTALIGVMDHGTASFTGKIPGVVWAGKTGSVEHGRAKDEQMKTHAVFVGYAPAENPRIAICVLIENAGHGGDVAAPPARDIVESYLRESESKAPANTLPAASASAANSGLPNAR
ncbi:MAG: penicillin-binding protein 2 [Fimbriimonas sp.]|nr:penicillin-binding protein 2 [Fimbriimonas sp.]